MSAQQGLTRSLEDLVSSLSRDQVEQVVGEEWNSFEENMLTGDAAAVQAGDMSQWATTASPPSFLGSMSGGGQPKQEGGGPEAEVMQEIAHGGFEFEEDRSDRDMTYAQSLEEANHWSLWQYQNSTYARAP